MTTQKDGQTTEASRRRKERIPQSEREGLGAIFSQSEVNGTEQIGASSEDRQRGNTVRTTEQRETPAGKILKRLNFIQDEYLSYVRGHQQRLETRLDESKEKEAVFLQAVRELEQEIYNLVSTEELLEKSE